MDDLSLKQRVLDLCGKGYRHHMQGDLAVANSSSGRSWGLK